MATQDKTRQDKTRQDKTRRGGQETLSCEDAVNLTYIAQRTMHKTATLYRYLATAVLQGWLETSCGCCDG
eukprot:COSAG06_NODE_818_length_12113_cov_9.211670_12_plen_70_part_00